jgi:deazaflavin-dependent oxidoreductase (nitroreductase family)
MPFPKALARFNKYVTNRFVLLFAGWIPPFAVVKHRGRSSGSLYRTPVLAFTAGGGYVFALTYGRDVDWVKNLFAGGGSVVYGGVEDSLVSIGFIAYEEVKNVIPRLVRVFFRLLSVEDCVQVGIQIPELESWPSLI